MTLEKSERHAPTSPCDVDWDAMRDQGTHRFCDHCNTPVHDLSKLTRDEVAALVARHDAPAAGRLCVRYEHLDGEVFLKDSTSPMWRLSRQIEGAKKLLAAAALVVPMLAACDSSAPTPPPATAPREPAPPISLDAGAASLSPTAHATPDASNARLEPEASDASVSPPTSAAREVDAHTSPSRPTDETTPEHTEDDAPAPRKRKKKRKPFPYMGVF